MSLCASSRRIASGPYAVSRFDCATSAGGPMDEIPIQLEHTFERPGKPLAITRDEHQRASLLTLEHMFWPPKWN